MVSEASARIEPVMRVLQTLRSCLNIQVETLNEYEELAFLA